MKEEKKVVHEVKLDKSIIKLLWVFAVVLLLNAVPDGMIIPDAFAQTLPTVITGSIDISHSGSISCNRGCP